MTNPKISLITPTKNRASLIGDMIESIIAQTLQEWELIIIDDNSTDNTEEVVTKYSENDSRIHFYHLETGTGPGAARNYGIQQAVSDLICICDSDDVSLPERLELTNSHLSKPEVDVVYGNLEIVNIETGDEQTRKSPDFSLDLLKKLNFIPNPTAAFKKSIFIKSGGYDPELRTSEDYDLWLRLGLAGHIFLHIDNFLVKMRVHPESTTKNTAADTRKDNLRRIRQRYSLGTPTLENTLPLLDEGLRSIYSTEGAQNFWFTD